MKRILLCIIFITIATLCFAQLDVSVNVTTQGPPTWTYELTNLVTSHEDLVMFQIRTRLLWGEDITPAAPAGWTVGTSLLNWDGANRTLVTWEKDGTATNEMPPETTLGGFEIVCLEPNTICAWDAEGDVGGTDAGITAAPLPVELSSFMVNLNSQNYAELNWTTQTESENMGWNIYRATQDLAEEAQRITPEIIPGSGTSSVPTDYSFTDEELLTEGETYWYWIESVSLSGEHHMYSSVSVKVKKGKIPEDTDTPNLELNQLCQNYPNPFNPVTVIEYNLSEESDVKLEIFNLKGQLVKTYEYTALPKGRNSTTWNGRDSNGNLVGSGAYLYKLTTSKFTAVKKAVLIK